MEAVFPGASPKYSVVIPCFRSEKSIPELLNRIVRYFEKTGESFEVICVNDSSPDNVGRVILDFHRKDPRIKLINLFRNYGQHHALLVGFQYSRGDYVVTIDDDLQHAPEDISLLVDSLGKRDVLMGAPRGKKHALYRNAGSWLMRMITRAVFHPPPGYASSAFRIIRRPVIDQIVHSHSAYPFIPGMLLRTTRNVGSIEVEHHERKSGRSGYSLSKSLALASNLIINYTNIPLHVLTSLGVVISTVSFALILYIVLRSLLATHFQAGWPSLIVVISFFGGINLLALAVIAEYLIRLLNEVTEAKKVVVRDAYLDAGSGCEQEPGVGEALSRSVTVSGSAEPYPKQRG